MRIGLSLAARPGACETIIPRALSSRRPRIDGVRERAHVAVRGRDGYPRGVSRAVRGRGLQGPRTLRRDAPDPHRRPGDQGAGDVRQPQPGRSAHPRRPILGGDPRPCEEGDRRGPRCVSVVVPDGPDGPRPDHAPRRGPDVEREVGTRRAHVLREREESLRGRGRRGRSDRLPALLRAARRKPRGIRCRDGPRREERALSLRDAPVRRVGRDLPVQLPARDRDGHDRGGPDHGEHGRPQAGERHAVRRAEAV